ncbi:MAG: hypothetical protein ICV64_01620 [Thermoleophilia bacterium]|nr:hypothetical protein [Thermoleophilia bacterium]
MTEVSGDDPTAERIARNDAIFRAANERISGVAAEQEMQEGVPFLCECADPTCREIVVLALREYEEIRAESRRFFNIPGHERSDRPYQRVVARNDRYHVHEKLGRAGEVADELDPRVRA